MRPARSLEYEMPKSSKLNPFTISKATLVEMLGKRGEKKIKNYLSQFLQGVSGQTADEILLQVYAIRLHRAAQKEAEKLADQIHAFFSGFDPLEPTMYLYKDHTPFFFSPTVYHSVTGLTIQCNNTNELVDSFYYKIFEKDLFLKKQANLHKRIFKQIDKLSYKLKKQLESLENAKKADKI